MNLAFFFEAFVPCFLVFFDLSPALSLRPCLALLLLLSSSLCPLLPRCLSQLCHWLLSVLPYRLLRLQLTETVVELLPAIVVMLRRGMGRLLCRLAVLGPLGPHSDVLGIAVAGHGVVVVV